MHNLLVNPIYLLILCAFFAKGPQPIYNSAVDLATATPTISLQSQTPAATSGTPAHTHTPTTTPSQTATSGTPTHTFTPSLTTSQTPTTTLKPLPAITLIFPVSTSTFTATSTPLFATHAETPEPSVGADGQSILPRIQFLVIVLIALWLFLAGFLIVYLRQLK